MKPPSSVGKTHRVLVRTSSTDYGPHFWLSWLGCERKAWLDSIARQHRDPSKLSGIIYFDIGSILHALKALHYSLEPAQAMAIDTNRLVYETDGGPLATEEYEEAIREAERLYRAYRAYWGPGDLGKILHIEEEFRAALTETVEVTGGVDLISKMGKRDLARSNLDGEPGIYIHDTKTRGSKDPHEYELALHSIQFATYDWLVEQKYGEKLKGVIVDLAYKATTPTFERILVPRMALKNERNVAFEAILRGAAARRDSLRLVEDGEEPPVRINECFKRSRAGWEFCTHYKTGQCKRR